MKANINDLREKERETGIDCIYVFYQCTRWREKEQRETENQELSQLYLCGRKIERLKERGK